MLPAWATRVLFALFAALLIGFWIDQVLEDDGLPELLTFVASVLVVAALALLLGIDALFALCFRRKWQRLIALCVLLVSFGPGSCGAEALTMLCVFGRLRAHELEYEQLARSTLAGERALPGQLCAFRDECHPGRAAIVWSGFLDNWNGLVFDPTQTFDSADERAFGGKMISNTHLWGPWYYVTFT